MEISRHLGHCEKNKSKTHGQGATNFILKVGIETISTKSWLKIDKKMSLQIQERYKTPNRQDHKRTSPC